MKPTLPPYQLLLPNAGCLRRTYPPLYGARYLCVGGLQSHCTSAQVSQSTSIPINFPPLTEGDAMSYGGMVDPGSYVPSSPVALIFHLFSNSLKSPTCMSSIATQVRWSASNWHGPSRVIIINTRARASTGWDQPPVPHKTNLIARMSRDVCFKPPQELNYVLLLF